MHLVDWLHEARQLEEENKQEAVRPFCYPPVSRIKREMLLISPSPSGAGRKEKIFY